MLVRAFRLTDKLSNALLKLNIYVVQVLLERIVGLRQAIELTVSTVTTSTYSTGRSVFQSVTRSSRAAYDVASERQQRLQKMMAQRAITVTDEQNRALQEATVVEDPLIVRNRNLSAITVVLLVVLIGVIFWATGTGQEPSFSAAPIQSGIIPTNPPNNNAEPVIPTPSLTPTPQSQFLSDVRGTLVFTVRQNGQDDIWALPANSTQAIRLTDSLRDDRSPAWSPDGTQIAFASRRDGPWDLYVLNLVTGALRRVTSTPGYEGSPTWSPDGAFLAYEGYNEEAENLDIYIIRADGQEAPIQLTFSPLPDLEPDWAPGEGRQIAYVGWRGGQRDILIIDLNNPSEESAINVTNTPEINENFPNWSPEGNRLAYTGDENNIDGIYVRTLEDEARLIGRGQMPTWNPVDGASVFYTIPQPRSSAIYLGQVDNFGVGANAVAFQAQVTDLDWADVQLNQFPNQPNFSLQTAPLVVEEVDRRQDGSVSLKPIPNLDIADAILSDTVDDSFEALREAALEKVGYDILSSVESTLWRLDRRPEPGEDPLNWHYTGRAFSLERDLVFAGNPTPIVIIREDTDIAVVWRVMARVAQGAQDGTLGEPLRALPWDFSARFEDDPAAVTAGGRQMTSVPEGYYVDLTELFRDFGFERIFADRTWRSNFSGILFWHFQKTDNLTWDEAMLEIYDEQQVEDFKNGTLRIIPTQIPTATATPEAGEPTLAEIPDDGELITATPNVGLTVTVDVVPPTPLPTTDPEG